MTENQLLTEALGYGAAGWAVFPCRTKAQTLGGKVYGAKSPLTPNGCDDATTDAGIIRAWWGQWPDAAIGFVPGSAGLVCVDIDVKDGALGMQSWAELTRKHGQEIALTRYARTPSGGLHLYYSLEGRRIPNTNGKLGPGIETRSMGQYVILAPSAIDTGAYAWGDPDADIIPFPADLLEILPRKKDPAGHGNGHNVTPPATGDILGGAYWLQRAIGDARVGNRHDTGRLLVQQLRAARLSFDDARPFALQYAAHCETLGGGNRPAADAMLELLDWAYSLEDFDLEPATAGGPLSEMPPWMNDAPPPEGTTDEPPSNTVSKNLETQPAADEPKPTNENPRESLLQVVKTFRRWLYMRDPGALYVTLGAAAANQLDGDPVWLLLIGVPGGGKTENLWSLSKLPYIHPVGTLTEGSLLSGTSKREKASDAKGGLLRSIGKFGILLVKDFGSILELNKETRGSILQALRECYDGAWVRAVGTDGGRTLEWRGKLGFIGGATPAIDASHATMAILGERFCFYRLPDLKEKQHAHGALKHLGHEQAMRTELSGVVKEHLQTLDIPKKYPELTETEQEWLIALARYTARARSGVLRDGYTREVLQATGCEAPTRLVLVLAKLLCGLQIVGVRRRLAYRLVQKVALDSMPQIRRAILDTLIKQSWVETPDIAKAIRCPVQTTRRALEDLEMYNLVDVNPAHTYQWRLSEFGRELYDGAHVVPEILLDMQTLLKLPLCNRQYFGNDDEPEAEHDDYNDAKPLF